MRPGQCLTSPVMYNALLVNCFKMSEPRYNRLQQSDKYLKVLRYHLIVPRSILIAMKGLYDT